MSGVTVAERSSPEEHLDAEETARYIAGSVSDDERHRIEAHLARCGECVAEVVAVSRIRRGAGSRKKATLVGLAAAAAIALAVGVYGAPKHDGTPDDIRGPRAPSVPVVPVVAPLAGELLPPSGSFSWRTIPGAITYRMSISDRQGNQVWTITTSDTA